MTEGYQKRAAKELTDLNEKIDRLNKFINSKEFLSLPDVDQEDLPRQLSYMRLYSAVLARRVMRMKGTEQNA